MKQFLTVLKFELNNYFKNRSFVLTTVLLAVVFAGIIIVPTVIPGLLNKGGQKQEEAAENGEDMEKVAVFINTEEISDGDALLSEIPVKAVVYEDADSLRADVENGTAEAGFIVNSLSDVVYVVDNLSMDDSLPDMFEQALTMYQKEKYLLEKGLSQEEIRQADSFFVNMEPEILGKNSARNYGYTYALIFIIYFLILFYGQMIAVSVTTEKSNRAIEILVTSVNSNSLIFGKVLAGAISGVVQMIVILGSGFASYGVFRDAWGGKLDFLFDIPVKVLAAYAVFGLFSYLLYAFIYGTLGAMVSKTEDISKSSTPVTMIYLVSFFIAMFGMGDCDSLLMKVASFIPFTSGNAMFIRISMGSVAVWEIALSGILLVLGCLIVGWLAAKIFRFGTLYYGNPLKIRRVLKQIREK